MCHKARIAGGLHDLLAETSDADAQSAQNFEQIRGKTHEARTSWKKIDRFLSKSKAHGKRAFNLFRKGAAPAGGVCGDEKPAAGRRVVRPGAADGIIPAMPGGTGWTRDEQLVALRLYMRTAFGRLHARKCEDHLPRRPSRADAKRPCDEDVQLRQSRPRLPPDQSPGPIGRERGRPRDLERVRRRRRARG